MGSLGSLGELVEGGVGEEGGGRVGGGDWTVAYEGVKRVVKRYSKAKKKTGNNLAYHLVAVHKRLRD